MSGGTLQHDRSNCVLGVVVKHLLDRRWSYCREQKGFTTYRIAGNFRGRMFSRISRIDSDSRNYSPRTFCIKPMLIYGVPNLDKMIASMSPPCNYDVTS